MCVHAQMCIDVMVITVLKLMIFLVVSVPNGYASADLDYYWPFDFSKKSESPDLVHGQMAQLKNGSLIQNTPERGGVAELSRAGAWISLGDFKGKC